MAVKSRSDCKCHIFKVSKLGSKLNIFKKNPSFWKFFKTGNSLHRCPPDARFFTREWATGLVADTPGSQWHHFLQVWPMQLRGTVHFPAQKSTFQQHKQTSKEYVK